jgi:archaellum component FlaC
VFSIAGTGQIKHENTLNFFTLGNRLERVENGLKDVEISNTRLEQGQAQTNTAIAQIKTVVEITEETVNNMDEGLKEVVQDHRERIERLEKETSTITHKN